MYFSLEPSKNIRWLDDFVNQVRFFSLSGPGLAFRIGISRQAAHRSHVELVNMVESVVGELLESGVNKARPTCSVGPETAGQNDGCDVERWGMVRENETMGGTLALMPVGTRVRCIPAASGAFGLQHALHNNDGREDAHEAAARKSGHESRKAPEGPEPCAHNRRQQRYPGTDIQLVEAPRLTERSDE